MKCGLDCYVITICILIIESDHLAHGIFISEVTTCHCLRDNQRCGLLKDRSGIAPDQGEVENPRWAIAM